MKTLKLSKRYANVNTDLCVACGACVKVCPKGAISVFKGCNAEINEKLCIGCSKCAKECPAGCIEVRERETI